MREFLQAVSDEQLDRRSEKWRVPVNPSLHRAAALVAAVVFVLLCSLPNSAREVPAQNQPSVRSLTANDIFAELGRTVPEFGGMFIDEASRDTLDVYVLDDSPGMMERLDAAINAVPELASARAAQPRIKLLPGQYSFVQLKEWHDRMSPVVLAIPGAVLTAVDQITNRLLVGVEDLGLEPRVSATLAELGIPREAVNIEASPRDQDVSATQTAPPVSAEPAAATTLQSEIRPLVGGIALSHALNAKSYVVCTLGFIASRGDVAGLVTNSHCTNVQGGVENTMFFQPEPVEGNITKIGVESVDPCYYLANADPPSFPKGCKPVPPPIPPTDKCAPNEACRYSDSAFVTQEEKVAVKLGFIARPVLHNNKWEPPDTFYQIVGEQSVVIAKTFVSWVGQYSGWRDGPVTEVCANSTIDGYTLLCQNLVASGPGNQGDSGSPVFACIDGSEPPKIVECPGTITDKISRVNLVGIKWGSSSLGAFRQTAYSPIGSMSDGKVKGVQESEHELGPLKKCAGGGC